MEINQEVSMLLILLFGFLLGLQHAVEADHLAAVTTIVSERKNIWHSALIGGLWGIGHTVSLFLIGILVIFLKFQISEELEAKLEAGVGIMLVILGINAFRKLWKNEQIHLHSHSHDKQTHTHLHGHNLGEKTPLHHNLSPRSIIIGMVHGLAGSAALMLIVVPQISSPWLGLGYILIFGIGSIAGMMAMSFLIGLPFHFTEQKFNRLNFAIRCLAGIFSLGWGFFLIYEKLLVS